MGKTWKTKDIEKNDWMQSFNVDIFCHEQRDKIQQRIVYIVLRNCVCERICRFHSSIFHFSIAKRLNVESSSSSLLLSDLSSQLVCGCVCAATYIVRKKMHTVWSSHVNSRTFFVSFDISVTHITTRCTKHQYHFWNFGGRQMGKIVFVPIRKKKNQFWAPTKKSLLGSNLKGISNLKAYWLLLNHFSWAVEVR